MNKAACCLGSSVSWWPELCLYLPMVLADGTAESSSRFSGLSWWGTDGQVQEF